MKKMPKKLFVVWKEGSHNEDGWYQADTKPNDFVEYGEETTIGVYQLIELKRAVNKTELH